jgi:hypothetical protein
VSADTDLVQGRSRIHGAMVEAKRVTARHRDRVTCSAVRPPLPNHRIRVTAGHGDRS